MAIHVYQCPNGHVEEVIERAVDEHRRQCKECHRFMKLSVGLTAPPILKAGSGGFYKPSRPDRTE
jgi:predicted nucleic acid-binding Zn ribbon protein